MRNTVQNGRRPKITLALGGGGARGLAHLGVIEVLQDAGFEIERIVGISIGSLAGALCAFEPDTRRVQRRALDYLLSETFQRHQRALFGAHPGPGDAKAGGLFSWYKHIQSYLRANQMFHRVVRRPSLLPGVLLQDVVDHLLPDVDISSSVIPLSIVAVDLRSGRRVVLEKGSLRSAVRGSSSLPGIFPPVELHGMLLCDVGVLYSLPTTVARGYGPEYVIGVDVSSGIQPLSNCETAFDVLMRMDEIGEALFRDYVSKAADLVIHPRVAGIEWFDFSSSAELLEAGRVAAREALSALPQEPADPKRQKRPLRRLGHWFRGLVR